MNNTTVEPAAEKQIKPVSTGPLSGKKKDTRFKPGISGNPGGRPVGSKNKITEQFLDAICAEFDAHGPEALAIVRRDDPAKFLTLAAGLIPRDSRIEVAGSLSMLSDEDLQAKLDRQHKDMGVKVVPIHD